MTPDQITRCEERYRDMVRAIGPGFHPDTDPRDYISLPEQYKPINIVVMLAAARTVDLDVYAIALEEVTAMRSQ